MVKTALDRNTVATENAKDTTMPNVANKKKSYNSILLLCWICGFSYFATDFIIMATPRFSAHIGYISSATFTIGLYYGGTLFGAVPVARMFVLLGVRTSLLLTQSLGIVASLAMAMDTFLESFTLLLLCSFLMGIWATGLQQMRFIVSDSVENNKKSIAIGLLLTTSAFAAFFSAPVANYSIAVIGKTFFAIFFVQALTLIIATAALVLSRIQLSKAPERTARPLKYGPILEKPGVKTSILISALSYGAMTLLMAAVPVKMFNAHIPINISNIVMRDLILSMTLSAVFIGWLIAKTSTRFIALVAVALYVAMAYINIFLPFSLATMRISMILLGIGWSCFFIAGTTMLTQALETSQRLHIQGINDLFVFSASTIGGLFSGVILYHIGWQGVNILAFIITVAIFAMTVLFNPKKPTDIACMTP